MLYVADKEYLARHSQGAGFKIKQMRISRMPLPYDGTDCGDLHGKTDPHGSWTAVALIQSIGSTTNEGICERECPQSCHEQGYVARITTSLWPRASYYDRIKDSWKSQIPSMETMREAREARTNLAKLEVYYEELNYESVVESPAQDVWVLLSNIGGTLGFSYENGCIGYRAERKFICPVESQGNICSI
uniref:Uncharacterized protein n=1 Tax=Parascaris equorum TaxID=6256 RepID=A0A914RZB9_PAREQ